MQLQDLKIIERRGLDDKGGWYIFDGETLMTLMGPFMSERSARRVATAIERWAAEREQPVPPYREARHG
jgi:hypothetical protein